MAASWPPTRLCGPLPSTGGEGIDPREGALDDGAVPQLPASGVAGGGERLGFMGCSGMGEEEMWGARG